MASEDPSEALADLMSDAQHIERQLKQCIQIGQEMLDRNKNLINENKSLLLENERLSLE